MSDNKELIERLNDTRWIMNTGAVRACEIAADALERLTAERNELLAAIRDAKRTARLMHTDGGHEVVCLEPQLWEAIARVKGGAA